jgi:ADP-ribose pyrophosphatase
LLVERRYEPLGYALPGGFVEVGETVEEAVLREVKEETGLDAQIVKLLGVYSELNRDPRFH